MEKKPFARIDFKNCPTVSYDFTICTWDNVADYVDLVHDAGEFLDQDTYDALYKDDELPSATVSIVMMTDDEFTEWFEHDVEADA